VKKIVMNLGLRENKKKKLYKRNVYKVHERLLIYEAIQLTFFLLGVLQSVTNLTTSID